MSVSERMPALNSWREALPRGAPRCARAGGRRAGLACGDDKQPQIGSGPADDIDGVWSGTYIAARRQPERFLLHQLRAGQPRLTGDISFDGGAPAQIGGVIAESALSLAYGARRWRATARSQAAVQTRRRRHAERHVSGRCLSGTWIAAASVGRARRLDRHPRAIRRPAANCRIALAASSLRLFPSAPAIIRPTCARQVNLPNQGVILG